MRSRIEDWRSAQQLLSLQPCTARTPRSLLSLCHVELALLAVALIALHLHGSAQQEQDGVWGGSMENLCWLAMACPRRRRLACRRATFSKALARVEKLSATSWSRAYSSGLPTDAGRQDWNGRKQKRVLLPTDGQQLMRRHGMTQLGHVSGQAHGTWLTYSLGLIGPWESVLSVSHKPAQPAVEPGTFRRARLC